MLINEQIQVAHDMLKTLDKNLATYDLKSQHNNVKNSRKEMLKGDGKEENWSECHLTLRKLIPNHSNSHPQPHNQPLPTPSSLSLILKFH